MKLVGEITEQVQNTVVEIQEKQDVLLKEIGKLEYEKMALMSELQALQESTRKLLQQEVLSLGVPKGAEWQITKEGNVYVAEVGD